MLDSSGKPPSGILSGTLTDFGAFEECLDVSVTPADSGSLSDRKEDFRGQYCLMDIRAAFEKNIPLDTAPPKGVSIDGILWHPVSSLFIEIFK